MPRTSQRLRLCPRVLLYLSLCPIRVLESRALSARRAHRSTSPRPPRPRSCPAALLLLLWILLPLLVPLPPLLVLIPAARAQHAGLFGIILRSHAIKTKAPHTPDATRPRSQWQPHPANVSSPPPPPLSTHPASFAEVVYTVARFVRPTTSDEVPIVSNPHLFKGMPAVPPRRCAAPSRTLFPHAAHP